MEFLDIATKRQSCRSFDPNKFISNEDLDKILEAGRLAPSACNSQPYHFTVVKGDLLKKVAKLTQGPLGINRFTDNATCLIIISEDAYKLSVSAGEKLKHNDYRSIDIGITSAYITSEAHSLGIDSCIIGWFDNSKIKELCHIKTNVRLIIALGYKTENDKFRTKKRKSISTLVDFVE